MSAPPAPGIVQLAAIWELEGQLQENTFNYRVTGTIDQTLLRSMAQTYATWAAASHGLWCSSCALIKIYVVDLTSSTAQSLEFNVVPPVAGTDPSGLLPNNVTFSLKRMTGEKGRSKRGRIFLIGLSQDLLAAGSQEMTAAHADNYVTQYGILQAAQVTDNGATEVIYHKALGTGTDVTGYGYADIFLDSQRRRLPGHNRHR